MPKKSFKKTVKRPIKKSITKRKVGFKKTKNVIKKQLITSPMKKHAGYCSQASRHYKGVCNRVWNTRCTDQMTKSQLNKIVKDAKECARLRSKVTRECFNGKTDPGHSGAIAKMGLISSHCSKVKPKK